MKIKMKRTVCLMLAAALVLCLGACGKKSGEAGETVDAGTHVVKDHRDIEVTVPTQIDRIVVCDILPLPSVLTVFFDSASKIVGMSQPSLTAAQNGLLGELYPEILNVQTGFIDGTNVNVEELMKLEPDVVFYSASSPELGDKLLNAGFAAVAISVNKWDYNCVETLDHWIELLGEIFPENDKANRVKQFSDEALEMINSRLETVPESERPRSFFLFKYDESTLMTSGGQFFGQWWADAIGAVNVGQELQTDNSVSVNMEQVYDWNPDLIFVTNFTTAGPDDLYQNTVGRYDWSAVDAVQNGRVYKMPLGMYRSYTPGVDTPVTLLWMAKTAYPALFEDVDIVTAAKNYYKEVFGIELTDEQVSSIFAPAVDAGSGFEYQ